MNFVISAFYDIERGGVREVHLKKNGERAFYDTFEEACDVAERMLERLPKARSIVVSQYGGAGPRREFGREHGN